MADDLAAVGHALVMESADERQRHGGRCDREHKHPRSNPAEDNRIQVRKIAREAEAVQAIEHDGAQTPDRGQLVDEQQRGNDHKEERGGESRSALHVEKDVRVEQRAEHEVQGGRREAMRALAHGDEAGKEHAGKSEIQALLDQDFWFVDAADHEGIEDKPRGEEREMLPRT